MTGNNEQNIERLLGSLEADIRNIKEMLSSNSTRLGRVESQIAEVEGILQSAKGSWKLMLGIASVVASAVAGAVWFFQNFTMR
jgi:hypothetical protein